ncbi:MAG: tetratricopeptide repeat protein, partial [Planctomycetota bacterium]
MTRDYLSFCGFLLVWMAHGSAFSPFAVAQANATLTKQQQRLEQADKLNSQFGELYEKGKYREAIPLAEQALKIRKEVLGEEHPDTANSLNNLMTLEAAVGHWPEASNLEDAARRGIRRHVARVLPGLSAKEQLVFLQQTDERPFYAALSLGYERRTDPTIALRSATWLINGKAVAQA